MRSFSGTRVEIETFWIEQNLWIKVHHWIGQAKSLRLLLLIGFCYVNVKWTPFFDHRNICTHTHTRAHVCFAFMPINRIVLRMCVPCVYSVAVFRPRSHPQLFVNSGICLQSRETLSKSNLGLCLLINSMLLIAKYSLIYVYAGLKERKKTTHFSCLLLWWICLQIWCALLQAQMKRKWMNFVYNIRYIE